MTRNWPKVRLGDVLRLDLDRVPVDSATTYPMVGVLSFGRGLFEREPIVNGNTSYKFFCRLKPDHVVMSQLFGWEGAVALSSKAYAGKFLSPQFPTFLCDPTKLDRQFLGWLMRRPGFWEDLGSRASGMGDRRRTLNPEALFACQIPLPPLTEQRKTAARIEDLAVKIREARALRLRATEDADMLWGRVAARVFDRATKKHQSRSLSEVVSIRGGGTPSKSDPLYWEGPIPWISPKDMKARELHDATDHISERAIRETAAKLINEGSVLVVVRGMILAHTFPSAVLRKPAAINQDMKALVPSDEILPEFLCSFFWAQNAELLALVEKSTHDTRKLETPKLLGTKIPVPPVAEQRRILADLDRLQKQVDSLRQLQVETASKLEALMPSILDKAFRGEL